MQVDGLSFRTLPFSECADIVAAFRNSQREVQRDAAFFDWRYAQRPTGLAAYVTLGFDTNGAAVAAASLIPHRFLVAGAPCMAGMVGDISVAASQRGRGVAAALLAELRGAAFARGLDACFVLPNKEVTGALTRAGFMTVGTIRRVIRLVSVRAGARRRAGALGGFVGALADGALRASDALTEGSPPAGFATAQPVDFDARYDGLWQRLPKQAAALAQRDAAWLRWRFRAKPGAPYRIFELTSGAALAGYVVHHNEESRVCVDDFLAADEESARWLGRAFAAQVRSAGWGDAIQVRYVEQSALPAPFRGVRYVVRADSQAVMWTATPAIPQVRNWFVTPADKDV